MGFRGSEEASRARIEALEAEVRDLRARVEGRPSVVAASDAEEVEEYYRGELDEQRRRHAREREQDLAESRARMVAAQERLDAFVRADDAGHRARTEAYELAVLIASEPRDACAHRVARAIEAAEAEDRRLRGQEEAAQRALAATPAPEVPPGDDDEAQHRRRLAEVEHGMRRERAGAEALRLQLELRGSEERRRWLTEIARALARE